MDADGQHRWSKRFGTPADDWRRVYFAGQGGTMVLAGGIEGAPIDLGAGPVGTPGDWLVAKLDPAGDLVWSRVFSVQDARSIHVDVGQEGEVLLAGSFDGNLDFGSEPPVALGDAEVFVAKLGPDGATRWSLRYGGALVADALDCLASGCNRVSDARLDREGNSLITGDFRGTVDFGGGALQSLGEGDGFVAKFGP